jgi:hypothetical protein
MRSAAPLMGSAPRLEPGIEPMGEGSGGDDFFQAGEALSALDIVFGRLQQLENDVLDLIGMSSCDFPSEDCFPPE